MPACFVFVTRPKPQGNVRPSNTAVEAFTLSIDPSLTRTFFYDYFFLLSMGSAALQKKTKINFIDWSALIWYDISYIIYEPGSIISVWGATKKSRYYQRFIQVLPKNPGSTRDFLGTTKKSRYYQRLFQVLPERATQDKAAPTDGGCSWSGECYQVRSSSSSNNDMMMTILW